MFLPSGQTGGFILFSPYSQSSQCWLLLTVLLLFPTPISRDFGLVSLLTGADKDSLDVLKGAGFGGKLKDPVGVGIKVSRSDAEARGNTVSYFIDGSGSKGGIRRGEIYQ